MLKKIKHLLKNTQTSPDLLQEIHKELKSFKKLLLLEMLQQEVAELGDITGKYVKTVPGADSLKKPNKNDMQVSGEKTENPSDNRAETLKLLMDIAAAKRTADGSWEFLLTRATENFEYENDDNGLQHTTTENTTWFAEAMSGEINQDGQNPVLTCWIPEKYIVGSTKPHKNTGTWDDLGKNPFAENFQLIVRPGTFRIHQSLNQRA